MPELRKHSAERVAADKEFAYLREDIEQFKKHQADKTVSLNGKQRLKEQEEAEARQKARDKERLARLEPPETVYELTLKQAGLPGLPPPVAKTNAALAKLSVAPRRRPFRRQHEFRRRRPLEPRPVMTTSTRRTPRKPATPDEPLVEAEHILVDYLSVLPKGNLAWIGRPLAAARRRSKSLTRHVAGCSLVHRANTVMKRAFALIGAAALLAGSLFADPHYRQAARLGTARPEQRPAGRDAAQPAGPARPAAAPPGAIASPTPIQQSIAKLRADLAAIKANSPATAAQKQKIATDLIAAAQGANKPSPPTAASLANSLAGAFAEKPLADKDCSSPAVGPGRRA